MIKQLVNIYKLSTNKASKVLLCNVSTMRLTRPVVRFESKKKTSWFLFRAVIKQRLDSFLSASGTTDSKCFLFVAGDWLSFQEHGTRAPLIRNLAKLKIISLRNKPPRRIRLEATIQIQKAKLAILLETTSTCT